jgi:hypothetical protein
VVVYVLWGWLLIGTLVFLTGKCSKQQDGAAIHPIAVPAATRT